MEGCPHKVAGLPIELGNLPSEDSGPLDPLVGTMPTSNGSHPFGAP